MFEEIHGVLYCVADGRSNNINKIDGPGLNNVRLDDEMASCNLDETGYFTCGGEAGDFGWSIVVKSVH